MFWSGRQRKQSQEIRRLMARIINGQFSSAELLMESPERDARIETRKSLNLPVVIADYRRGSDVEPDWYSGITQDISCEGVAIMSQGPLPVGDVVLGIGPTEDWSVLQCKTLRSNSIGYGFFLSGLHVSKILPTNQYSSVLEYAQSLEPSNAAEHVEMTNT